MQEDPAGGQQEEESGGGINADVLRSYAAFARRAIKQRWLLSSGVLLVGLGLTLLIAKYAPRTYKCTTVLTAVANGVLDSDRGPLPLAGAENQIMSHDNLVTLINDAGLKKNYAARRPPLLALKDKIIQSLSGPMDDKVLTAVLVGTLENKLTLEVEKDTLSINVEWSDSATTAELAEATKDAFLRVRHGAEISAFQDKMAILDTHAGKLREEIDQLADQMKQRIGEKRAEAEAEAKAEAKKNKDASPEKRSAPARVVVAARKPMADAQLPELRQRLVTLKQSLTTAETQRESRLRDEQAKLNELKMSLTPNHPQVITQQERVGMASQVSSDILLMRAEQADMESQIRQREAMASGKGSERVVALGSSAGSDLVPNEVLGLLDEKDADPALSAQISGAIVRYGSLRDDVRGAKLALDTAQAAFNHRYRVVIPVEAPSQPIKPKVGVVVGAGIAIALLLALLLPILLELRRDVVSEAWQVHQLQLPVLAELRLPKGSRE